MYEELSFVMCGRLKLFIVLIRGVLF